MDQHNHLLDRLAYANGILTGFALYPQVYLSITSRATEGISTLAYGIILFNSIVWTLYAQHRGIVPLVVSSVLNGIASVMLVTLSLV